MSSDLFGHAVELPSHNALRRKFTLPPFTDLNSREGWWQDRKRWWISLGIQSEVGRGTSRPHNQGKDHRLGTTEKEYKGGDCWRGSGTLRLSEQCRLYKGGYQDANGELKQASGTSVFDPVVCELAYRWFTREGDQVIDPFAGGSVRGIVAHKLNRRYWGCDLRQEQIDANEQQAAEICPDAICVPVTVSGAMLRQRFHPCSPDYVAGVCVGRCCEGSDGIKVAVHPSEQQRIEQAGATVTDGFIVADSRGLCPFKTDDGRCKIHGSDKPFGCKASPFTLTEKGTLIVRNRYRLLRCYDCDGAEPAHEAHGWSLTQIFGDAEAVRIADEAAAGADKIAAMMPARHYAILADNHAAHNGSKIDAPKPALSWHCGDALELVPTAPLADFVFSCPPYGDLERYSEDPRDLSTMEYHTFMATLKRIILRCWQRLRDNRFAMFVVGEFRDKRGHYRNFVGDIVQAFQAAGFHYYNEAILITAIGSLPIRITKQFEASRKLGKTHQNVLVFLKGDGKRAASRLQPTV